MEQQIQLNSKTIIIALVGGICLLSIGGVVGYFLFSPSNPLVAGNTNMQSQNQNSMTINENSNSSVLSENVNEQENGNTNVKKEGVQWMTPKRITALGITKSEKEKDEYTKITYYKTGDVIGGQYDGYETLLLHISEGGIGISQGYFRFLRKGKNLVLLTQYSDEIVNEEDFIPKAFAKENSFNIPSLEFPKTIVGPKDDQVLERVDGYQAQFSVTSLKKVFHDATYGDVYTTRGVQKEVNEFSGNGFYISTPDGVAIYYSVKIPFVGEDRIPQIHWESGEDNSESYNSTDVGGCGSVNLISVMDEQIVSRKDLKMTGRTSEGIRVYEFADSNHPFLKNIYENDYTVYEGEKMSYNAFLASHPVFFWIDPFGRLIKFQKDTFVPPVECGKPVIYLYPEKTTDVTVHLEPKGGFSYTEPVYDHGWSVHASPDGTLIEKQSGKTYPYLFWEGRGSMYIAPEKGFMVKKEDIHGFLQEKLVLLGLRGKEVTDFIEFWEPRMQDKPYYFVGFIGTKEVNALAPLDVQPKPDSVLRILMDFTGVDAPYSVEEPRIAAPKRTGFTLVEWGGVLR